MNLEDDVNVVVEAEYAAGDFDGPMEYDDSIGEPTKEEWARRDAELDAHFEMLDEYEGNDPLDENVLIGLSLDDDSDNAEPTREDEGCVETTSITLRDLSPISALEVRNETLPKAEDARASNSLNTPESRQSDFLQPTVAVDGAVGDASHRTAIIDAASDYLDRGLIPLPIGTSKDYQTGTAGYSKRATIHDWPKLEVDLALFEAKACEHSNIGLRLDGNLVDIDLDCDEARRVALRRLPDTPMICGRKSAPRSHHFYIGDTPVAHQSFDDPSCSDGKSMLVEFRSSLGQSGSVTGKYTVVPPSIHPDTLEPIYWEGEECGAPAHVDLSTLKGIVARIAAAALMARHWRSGSRHEASLALAGALARNGWSENDARDFIEDVCIGAEDQETPERLKDVGDTYRNHDSGKPMTGLPKLESLFDKPIVQRLAEWLALDARDSKSSEESANHDWRPVNLNLWMSTQPPQVDYLFDGVFPKGIAGGLCAEGGTGKTFSILVMAISLAIGRALWPSLKPLQERRVMVLLGEDPLSVIHKRVHDIAETFNLTEAEKGVLDRNLKLYVVGAEPLFHTGDHGVENTKRYTWLKNEASGYQPDLLIIDPKSRWSAVDENSNDQATQVVNRLEQIVRPFNGSTLIIHHVSKSQKGEMSTSAVRGASAFPDACRIFFNLVKLGADGKQFRLQTTKNNYAGQFLAPIVLERQSNGVPKESDGSTDVVSKAADAIADWITANGDIALDDFNYNRGNALEPLVNHIAETIPGIREKEFRMKAIDLGLGSGALIHVKSGRKTMISVPEDDFADAEVVEEEWA